MTVQLRLSGGQFNTSPLGSLGGEMSDTVITNDVIQNLFDNVTRTEALVGRTEFRCFYVLNTGTTPLTGVVVEISVNPAVTQVSAGLDLAGKGNGRTHGVATTITTEDQVPSGVKFLGERNTDDGLYDTVVLPIGILRQNDAVAVWLKRKTEQAAAQTVSLTIAVTYDTVTLPNTTVSDGGAIGELLKVTVQGSGTYKIGTARIGFADVGSP